MATPSEHSLAFSAMKAGGESRESLPTGPTPQCSPVAFLSQHRSKQSFIHTRCSKNACLSGHYQSRRKKIRFSLRMSIPELYFQFKVQARGISHSVREVHVTSHRLAGGRKGGRTMEHIGGLLPSQDLQSAIPDIPTL